MMAISNKKYEEIEKVIEYATSDRNLVGAMVLELMVKLKSTGESHRDVGPVLSKYIDNMQRSNEQILKAASIILKEDRFDDDEDFSADDMFDEIKENEPKKGTNK